MISIQMLKWHRVPLNISRVSYNVKDVQQNRAPHQGQADFEVSENGVKTAIRVGLALKIAFLRYSQIAKSASNIHLQQAHTPVTGTAPSAAISPMNNLGVDLFDAIGKKVALPILWLRCYATHEKNYFSPVYRVTEYSLSGIIRSDSGPQFRSEFVKFFKSKDI